MGRCGLEISQSWWEWAKNEMKWVKNEWRWMGKGGSMVQYNPFGYLLLCEF